MSLSKERYNGLLSYLLATENVKGYAVAKNSNNDDNELDKVREYLLSERDYVGYALTYESTPILPKDIPEVPEEPEDEEYVWVIMGGVIVIYTVTFVIYRTITIIDNPVQIVIDNRNQVWVTNNTGVIYKFTISGTPITTVTIPYPSVERVVLKTDNSGAIWVVVNDIMVHKINIVTNVITTTPIIDVTVDYPDHRIYDFDIGLGRFYYVVPNSNIIHVISTSGSRLPYITVSNVTVIKKIQFSPYSRLIVSSPTSVVILSNVGRVIHTYNVVDPVYVYYTPTQLIISNPTRVVVYNPSSTTPYTVIKVIETPDVVVIRSIANNIVFITPQVVTYYNYKTWVIVREKYVTLPVTISPLTVYVSVTVVVELDVVTLSGFYYIWVADGTQLHIYDSNGVYIKTVDYTLESNKPMMAYSVVHEIMFVVDGLKVVLFDTNGSYVSEFALAEEASAIFAYGSYIYIALGNKLYKFDKNGNSLGVAYTATSKISSISLNSTTGVFSVTGVAGYLLAAKVNKNTGEIAEIKRIPVSGNVLSADTSENSISYVTDGKEVGTYEYDAEAGTVSDNPTSLTTDENITDDSTVIDVGGGAVVADPSDNTLRSISSNVVTQEIGGEASDDEYFFNQPTQILTSLGTTIVLDKANNRVVLLDRMSYAWKTISEYAGNSFQDVKAIGVTDKFAYDNIYNWMRSTLPSGVKVYDENGNLLTEIGDGSNSAVIDISKGIVYVTDLALGQIMYYTLGGRYIRTETTIVNTVQPITVVVDGYTYVITPGSNIVYIYDILGVLVLTINTGPNGLPLGDLSNLVVANGVVYVYSPSVGFYVIGPSRTIVDVIPGSFTNISVTSEGYLTYVSGGSIYIIDNYNVKPRVYVSGGGGGGIVLPSGSRHVVTVPSSGGGGGGGYSGGGGYIYSTNGGRTVRYVSGGGNTYILHRPNPYVVVNEIKYVNNYIYVINADNTIYLYDSSGTYLRTISNPTIKTLTNFYVIPGSTRRYATFDASSNTIRILDENGAVVKLIETIGDYEPTDIQISGDVVYITLSSGEIVEYSFTTYTIVKKIKYTIVVEPPKIIYQRIGVYILIINYNEGSIVLVDENGNVIKNLRGSSSIRSIDLSNVIIGYPWYVEIPLGEVGTLEIRNDPSAYIEGLDSSLIDGLKDDELDKESKENGETVVPDIDQSNGKYIIIAHNNELKSLTLDGRVIHTNTDTSLGDSLKINSEGLFTDKSSSVVFLYENGRKNPEIDGTTDDGDPAFTDIGGAVKDYMNRVWITDTTNNSVRIYNTDGVPIEFDDDDIKDKLTDLTAPKLISMGSKYIAVAHNNGIRLYNISDCSVRSDYTLSSADVKCMLMASDDVLYFYTGGGSFGTWDIDNSDDNTCKTMTCDSPIIAFVEDKKKDIIYRLFDEGQSTGLSMDAKLNDNVVGIYRITDFNSANGQIVDIDDITRLDVDVNGTVWGITSDGNLARFDLDHNKYAGITSVACNADEILFFSRDVSQNVYSQANPVIDTTEAVVFMLSEDGDVLYGQMGDSLTPKTSVGKVRQLIQVEDNYWLLSGNTIKVYDGNLDTNLNSITVSGAYDIYCYQDTVYVLYNNRIDTYNTLCNKVSTIDLEIDKAPTKFSIINDKLFMIVCNDDSIKTIKR